MAANACDPPLFSIPDDGVTVTLVTGGGFCGWDDEGAGLVPLQPVKNAGMARMAKNKRLRRKGTSLGLRKYYLTQISVRSRELVMALFPRLDWP